MPGKLLICDTSDETRDVLKDMLKEFNFEITEAKSGEEALEFLKSSFFNLVILDADIKDEEGREVLFKLKGMNPNVNIILTTTEAKAETAVLGIKLGVLDYLIKPLKKKEVIKNVEKVLDKGVFAKDEGMEKKAGLGLLVGISPKMQELYSKILNVASHSDSTVCIQGESGVGKELVARTIHELSPRKNAPFQPIHCSGITPALFESELFGHVRGAFSGAVKDNIGLFRSANHGTVFLDEIGEIPREMQVKLLRVLEDKKIRPVGSNKSYEIDVRLITATNRNLQRAVLEGKIRHDFLHRILVVQIVVPPLRERKEDIPLLVEHFLKELNKGRPKKRIEEEALNALCAYDWTSGNVRELENVIKHIYVTNSDTLIRVKDLPPEIRGKKLAKPSKRVITWEETQKNLIQGVLAQTGGNKSEAAKLLGITRMTLYRKLKRYGIK